MKSARGFSLPTAIFLLVILSLLGAFMVTLSTSQSITSAQDVQGSRAYRAARAGMEWAAGTICNGGSPCAAPLTACPTPPAPFTIDGFTVTVTCSAPQHNEGGTTRTIFLVTSTATIGGAPGNLGYVERRVGTFIEF